MEKYLTPAEVCEAVPGMTESKLTQLRFAGGGPLFLKPTPKTVVYRERDVTAWLDATAHERNDRPLAAAG